MSDQSGSSHLHVLFEAALLEYEKQTGIALAKHPLAEQLQNCDSVESVTAVLYGEMKAFSEFRESDKVLDPLKKVVSILYKLSATVNFGRDIGLHFPPVNAIHTGLGVLISAVKGTIDSYAALVDLLESIEHFLRRLDIYTKITPTVAMTGIVVKILVELLSAFALVTKQIKQGKSKKLFKKLLGEKDVEAVLQRLDRLTQEEARVTATQTLEVVHGLIKNIGVVMDGGKASADHVMDALKIIQQLASDQNKSKRDSLQKDILKWLSPPDPWKNHHIACDLRHRGSATWFIQGNTFLKWKLSEALGSALWIHGKPGAGKSVFCSTIIENLDAMRKFGLASLGFFYCDFREDEKKDLRGLLSSLLAQLCHQSDSYCDTLSKFYSEHAEGLRRPSDDALVGCLKSILKLPKQAPVYLIVDALDECPNIPALRSPRAKVLNLIEELTKLKLSNLRICVTSRHETDIKNVLNPLKFHPVSLHDQTEQKRDIEGYIKSVINKHANDRGWEEEHKQLVIDVLTEKADGMFRWVDCQAEHICSCMPAQIREALADLPETLDETYQRTLQKIYQVHWEFAHRLFQFVAVAFRPLRVEELAELLAFDFKAKPIPKFHEGWRLKDPVDAVLSTCSSLLAIVDGGHRFGKIIQFSHFSVKEFLTSDRLSEADDIISRRYHISVIPAHTLAAKACLGILLYLDKDVVTSDSLEKWPLAEYAAEHWAGHVRFEDVSRNVKDGMKQLFDPGNPHLAVWVWIYDPVNSSSRWLQDRRAKRPSTPHGTPLHYAALWDLHSVVEFLVVDRSQDVNSLGFTDSLTPLHLALGRTHMNAACMLIDFGADVDVRYKDGLTPLHLASRKNQVDVARTLIERGADLVAQDNNGRSPLHQASQEGQPEVARLLIERGADLAAQDENAETPLHLASQRGQVEVVRILIERRADVTAQNKDMGTPLHHASQHGKLEIARMLIERGAGVTAQNKDGHSPLHLALMRGRMEIARLLIECGADVAAQDKDGETPLHLASRRGQVEVFRMLIGRGADVTAQNKDGLTPLHLASQRGQVEVARILIERGADVTVQNKYGQTPLHHASQWGQVKVVCILIERGADMTAQNKYGQAPLHHASQWGQVEVVRMLIKRGVDVMAQDKNGHTPLHLASQRRQVEVTRMLMERGADVAVQDKYELTPLHHATQWEQAEVARLLIERGADLTAQNKEAETPLHQASRSGLVGVADMLVERGADVIAQDKYGQTPLHQASKWGRVEVARMIVERGVDVTAQNKDGHTPLHLASQQGQFEVARMLVERGADVTAKSKYGETPLHLASQRGQVEVARMLIELGADVVAQNDQGATPLHLVLIPSLWNKKLQERAEVARILLKHGADVNARNNCGLTPIRLASQPGLVKVQQVLLEHVANFVLSA